MTTLNTRQLPERLAAHLATSKRASDASKAHFHFGVISTLAELGLRNEAIDYAQFHKVSLGKTF